MCADITYVKIKQKQITQNQIMIQYAYMYILCMKYIIVIP